MNIQNIVSFLKKKKKFNKESFTINPNLYWKFILFLMFIMILSSFVFGFYLFTKLNKEKVTETRIIDEKSEKINRERLNKVLDFFARKEAISQDIINLAPEVIDPSL